MSLNVEVVRSETVPAGFCLIQDDEGTVVYAGGIKGAPDYVGPGKVYLNPVDFDILKDYVATSRKVN